MVLDCPPQNRLKAIAEHAVAPQNHRMGVAFAHRAQETIDGGFDELQVLGQGLMVLACSKFELFSCAWIGSLVPQKCSGIIGAQIDDDRVGRPIVESIRSV